jgi:Mg-chelatase subunit ChlD
VAGRHRSFGVSGQSLRGWAKLLSGGVALAMAFISGGVVLADVWRACEGRLILTVYAEPAAAPVLRAAADRLRTDRAAVDGTCIDVSVLDRSSSRVAARLTGAASGEVAADNLPDVWVPESSLWLDLVRGGEQTRSAVPPTSVSLAVSPVVVALVRPVAQRLGSRGKIGWARLLESLFGRESLAFGMPDPASSATGMAALYGLQEVLKRRKAPPTSLTAACRSLAAHTAPTVSELTARVPAVPSGNGLQAFPADEASVWRFNGDDPGVPLVAAYPTEGALWLDFPYAVLPRAAADPGRSEAAARLVAETIATRGDAAIFAAGLRLSDGTPGPQADAVRGVSRQVPRTVKRPARAEVASLVQQCTAANLSARSLVLLDVSGSMQEQLPGAGNATRMEVTTEAAQRGLGLFEDDSMLGLWAFSTELTNTTDYRELVPLGRLSERLGSGTRRSEIAAAVSRLRAMPNGRTGLYDSILAAHRKVRAGYDPARVNSVIVLTDGRNEDPVSVTLDELVDELRRTADPKRPVPVIAIAFGPDVDMTALRRIARVTGGDAYEAKDPAQIGQVFLDAISKRTCRPNC